MNKCVLITGCSSGIGRATALHFHEQGWQVVATMRTPENVAELIRIGDVCVQALDVTSQASVDLAIDRALNKFGKIDVLVNNAGIGIYAVFEEVDEQVIRWEFK